MKSNYKPIFAAVSIAALATMAFAVAGAKSGLQPGDTVSAFGPKHVTGADAKSSTCLVCKYGTTAAVQVWVNGDSTDNVIRIAKELEGTIKKQGANNLKAFVIFIKPKGTSEKVISDQLSAIASQNGLKNVALTFVDGAKGSGVASYKINVSSEVKNTVMVYQNRKVSANFVNLKADAQGLKSLKSSVMKASGKDN